MESADAAASHDCGDCYPTHNPLPVLRIDSDGTLRYANEAATPLLRHWERAVGERMPEDWRQLIARVMRDRQQFETEVLADRTLYRVTLVPIAQHDAVHLYGYDATESARMIRELEEREELFRRAFQTSPDAININRLSDGVYVDVNRGFCSLTGYTREEVIGRSSVDISIWHDTEDRTRLIEGLRQHGSVQNLEARFRMKDGAVRTGLMSAQVIQVGGEMHILSITRDIEEFKAAREALRESEARMRSLQENLPLGLYRSTPDGRFVYVNTALLRMFGYDSREELYATSTEELYVDRQQRRHILSILEKHGLVKDWEVLLRRKDGSVVDCALNVRAVFDRDGNLQYQDGIVSDITDRKRIQEAQVRAKEQAEEANRIKSNFLATMSHELRTPLNGILGFANLLAEALEDNRELREMADIIHLSGHRLLDTLNGILDLSIVEAGKLAVQAEDVNVNTVVREVCLLYSASARSKGLELHSALPDGELALRTDERLLRQILNNLLNNAIKYTWEGRVSVVAEPEPGEGVRIHVSDTGIGISGKDQEVVFDEFRQASEGYSRAYDGTGLGLSVSQKFAHVLGGRITLISVPGKGSCFTLHLPQHPL